MNIWGRNLRLSIFGESHGEAIGIVIDGLPPGFPIDMDYVNFHMARRAPGQSELTTPRKESDQVEILSGVFNGVTTGAPLCGIIRNKNIRSEDYNRDLLIKTIMPFCDSSCMLISLIITPPPQAITAFRLSETALIASVSAKRKPSSPRSSKIRGMLKPSRC